MLISRITAPIIPLTPEEENDTISVTYLKKGRTPNSWQYHAEHHPAHFLFDATTKEMVYCGWHLHGKLITPPNETK